jgi:hypothetical protein
VSLHRGQSCELQARGFGCTLCGGGFSEFRSPYEPTWAAIHGGEMDRFLLNTDGTMAAMEDVRFGFSESDYLVRTRTFEGPLFSSPICSLRMVGGVQGIVLNRL